MRRGTMIVCTLTQIFICFSKDDFNFPIVNFPFICSNIPTESAYGVYISQWICHSRPCEVCVAWYVVFCVVLCTLLFVLCLMAIVMPVLLRLMASDYHFGIFNFSYQEHNYFCLSYNRLNVTRVYIEIN